MKLKLNEFRIIFDQFKNESLYPDFLIEHELDVAECYLGTFGGSDCRLFEFQLMVAHLLYLRSMIREGKTHLVIADASENEISVTLVEPPTSGAFQYWLAVSPYGLQLLGIWKQRATSGMFVGGSPERDAFRKMNGGW